MSDKVVELNCITTLDIPAERVLKMAIKHGLESAVIVGFDKDGEFFFASSKADGGDVLWFFEMAKKRLMEIEL